jgi:hypothetical protein
LGHNSLNLGIALRFSSRMVCRPFSVCRKKIHVLQLTGKTLLFTVIALFPFLDPLFS